MKEVRHLKQWKNEHRVASLAKWSIYRYNYVAFAQCCILLLICRMLHESSASLADRFFRDGAPVMAACCHLAVGEVQVCVCIYI